MGNSAAGICNLALSHLGEIPSVNSTFLTNPQDIASTNCSIFYPMARDELLAAPDVFWTFAIKRISLAVVANVSISGWLYTYAKPSDIVRIIKLTSEDQDSFMDDILPVDYIVEGDYIYSNQVNAQLIYTQPITDSTKYPTYFWVALSWLLAYYLAGPITKSVEKQQACFNAYLTARTSAVAQDNDIGQIRNYPQYIPFGINARNTGFPFQSSILQSFIL